MGLNDPIGPRNPGPKCGLSHLLSQAPAEDRARLTQLVEDPDVDPIEAYTAVAAAFKFHAPVRLNMVAWHRKRGADCPCRALTRE